MQDRAMNVINFSLRLDLKDPEGPQGQWANIMNRPIFMYYLVHVLAE